MSLRSRSSVLALAGAAALSVNACKTRDFNPGSGVRQAAPSAPSTADLPAQLLPGVPNPDYIAQGVFSYNNPAIMLITNERNQVTSKVRVAGGSRFSAKDNPSMSIDGVEAPGTWYGRTFTAASPVKCNDLSMIFANKKIVGNDSQMCQFEMHSTATVLVDQAPNSPEGDSKPSAGELSSFFEASDNIGQAVPKGQYWGFSIIIIPLGADGQGYKQAYYDGFLDKGGQTEAVGKLRSGLEAKAAPRSLSEGPIAKVDAGKVVAAANTKIDADAAMKAFKAVKSEFAVDDTYRNSCLMNVRAKNWTDLAAHYYCQLPYESIRTCYSGALVMGGEQLERKLLTSDDTYKALVAKAAAPSATDDERAAPNGYKIPMVLGLHEAAWQACFEPASGVTVDSADDKRSAAAKWIAKNQAQAFKHFVWTVPGTWDFNTESEQKLLNEFYGSDRPRRALDTWPKWEMVQPRYDKVRKFQMGRLMEAAGK